jgi:hypothetical protein
MHPDSRQLLALFFALAAAAFGIFGFASMSASANLKLGDSIVAVGAVVALLATCALLFQSILPGRVDPDRVALLAVAVAGGVALCGSGWGAYLPLAAAIAAAGVARIRRTD